MSGAITVSCSPPSSVAQVAIAGGDVLGRPRESALALNAVELLEDLLLGRHPLARGSEVSCSDPRAGSLVGEDPANCDDCDCRGRRCGGYSRSRDAGQPMREACSDRQTRKIDSFRSSGYLERCRRRADRGCAQGLREGLEIIRKCRTGCAAAKMSGNQHLFELGELFVKAQRDVLARAITCLRLGPVHSHRTIRRPNAPMVSQDLAAKVAVRVGSGLLRSLGLCPPIGLSKPRS
jgi:hypothetical protein